MMLKTSKKKGGKRKKGLTRQEDDDEDNEDAQKAVAAEVEPESDPDDPLLSTPMPRYNAMLAVLRNTLYMYVFMNSHSIKSRANFMTSYGGIFERGSREFTLDDFYSLALDKMDRYVCLKKSDVIIPPEGDDVSSSSDEDDDDGDDSDEDEESDEETLSGEEEVVAEPVGAMHGKRCTPSSDNIQTEGFPARPSDGLYGGLQRYETF